ncbi:MAG: FAD-binding protein, partial [Thermoplasmatales archaeon]
MCLENVLINKNSKFEEAINIAKKGTHCGMCRIDFLGTGLCSAGKKNGFIAYWPQGRMEIVNALNSGKVKPTKKLFEIVESCTFCGICDKQCNFTTQLRPQKVHEALKEYVQNLGENEFQEVPEDDKLKKLQEIVGEKWATNDPVIIASYRRNIVNPDKELNFYAVMPENSKELSEVIKFANKNNLQFMARGGGTLFAMVSSTVMKNAMGLEDGIIIDLLRMKKLEINPDDLTATVGAGITAFELQKEAYKHGLRANVAEAGAHICANLASTGICTTWGNTYGWASDNYTDVELVDEEGNIFNHGEMEIK